MVEAGEFVDVLTNKLVFVWASGCVSRNVQRWITTNIEVKEVLHLMNDRLLLGFNAVESREFREYLLQNVRALGHDWNDIIQIVKFGQC